jgi:predicted nucleic acid-binding protein
LIVVDASAALEVLLRTAAAAPIEARIFDPSETLHAPHLIDVEVTQVLRRYVLSGQIDEQRGLITLQAWLAFPVQRYSHEDLLPRAWELRSNVTAYDGVYIALAELLDAPLLTHDARLAKAPGHSATIELL